MSERTLTIKQALAEGYSLCGHDGQEILDHLDYMTEESLKELLKLGPMYLFSKESTYLAMNATDIWQYVMECNELSDVGWEDTAEFLDGYSDKLQTLLDEIMAESNKRRVTNTYHQTEIKLILE